MTASATFTYDVLDRELDMSVAQGARRRSVPSGWWPSGELREKASHAGLPGEGEGAEAGGDVLERRAFSPVADLGAMKRERRGGGDV